ncbi:MAG: class I SAM-dependent methyltransferase [Alphaproteobacteria bacterium]
MKNDSRFWDRHAARYAKSPVSDEASYQKKLEITRAYLRPDLEVLEFGCGTGSTALVHATLVKHIRATDISPKMIEIARAKADAAEVSNVDFAVAAIDTLDMPEESFDVVMGHSILHLVRNRDDVIRRVFRTLRPGGVFVSSTVCLGETMKWFKFIGPIGEFIGLLPIVRVFAPQELVTGLMEAGFEIDHRWQPGRGKATFVVAKKPNA